MATPGVEARLSARAPPQVRDLIAQAADAVGATVNQFVVQSAVEKATEVLERERVVSLSSSGAEAVLALMESPPEPSGPLKEALRSRESLLCPQ
ncbi:MAG: DUF1778 domain-containing protein [Deferrisomatales bacterium]|nr:DUF1778 domain-containing protein [Deferrisomatales bacterium]